MATTDLPPSPSPSPLSPPALPESDFRFVPVAETQHAPDGIVHHYRERWWCVHPEKGLAFFIGHRGSSAANGGGPPQCNPNESIVRRLAQNYPWCEVRYFASVFVRVNPRDYC